MNDTTLKITAVIIVILVLLLFLYFLRKIEKKNNVLTVDEASLDWKDARCIKYEKMMEKGYAFAGKGINWVPKNEKKPSIFSTLGSVLENTFSLRIIPAINMAWYCKSCKILAVDNSKMLKIKNI